MGHHLPVAAAAAPEVAERPAVPAPSAGVVPLLLVDGPNLLYTALRRCRGRTGWMGPAATTAAVAATKLHALIQRREFHRTPEVVVCFDGEHGSDWRRAVEPAYKQHRCAPEPQARVAADWWHGLLTAAGIAWVELDDQEADDVIATLAAFDPERSTAIVSADQDLVQLVTERVWILDIGRRPGRCRVGPATVWHRYGITAAQWCDYRALVGDRSDNIPGVSGLDLPAAADLLAGGLSLDQLQAAGRLTGPLGWRIAADWEGLLRRRAVIRLRGDLQVPWRPSGTSSLLPDPAAVLEHLTRRSTSQPPPSRDPGTVRTVHAVPAVPMPGDAGDRPTPAPSSPETAVSASRLRRC